MWYIVRAVIVKQLASGMRQLAGTRTRHRRAHAAPLAGLISGRAEYRTRVVIQAGTHAAEKLMAERPQVVVSIFLPISFLPDLT